MAEQGVVYWRMPGGIGTLEELFENPNDLKNQTPLHSKALG